jgi:hypothetical protein
MATTESTKPRKRAAAAADEPAAAEPQSVPVPAEEPVDPPIPVELDLDTLSKFDIIDDAVEELFTFRLKGHVFEMCDPRDINWQDIFQSLRNPAMFMRYAIPQDQQDIFYALEMPAWQLSVLMERWHKHYKMANPGDIAKLITG